MCVLKEVCVILLHNNQNTLEEERLPHFNSSVCTSLLNIPTEGCANMLHYIYWLYCCKKKKGKTESHIEEVSTVDLTNGDSN